jgi:hypothetical protein
MEAIDTNKSKAIVQDADMLANHTIQGTKIKN